MCGAMEMHQGGCHPLKVGTEDHAAAGLCGCEPLSLAAGVSPLARARRGAEGSARLGASCYAGREWEGGLEKNRVKDGEGMWEGTSEGAGRGQAPGSTGGVKLLFPLQTPAPRHPSCRSHRAAGSTCHLHTTSAAQHPRARRSRHPPRGWPRPPLSRCPPPTTAWRVPWAPGAAATAPSAGRSPLPPVPRTTTRLTAPGAGPGRWKTSTPSTEPPVLGAAWWGERGSRAPHRCTGLATSSCHHQRPSRDALLAPCCFWELWQRWAMSQLDLAPAPGLGQCWGCGRLKESVPF